MAFSRRELPAARRFVDSVYSAGGARIGRGSRHPSTWSDAYTLRVANVWQRQAAAGRELSLQEARRGPAFTRKVREEQAKMLARGKRLPGGLEHPRQRFVGPRTETGRPDEITGAGFYARQYRSFEAAKRFALNLPPRWPDEPSARIQIIAYGKLAEGYAGGQGDGWRIMFTGYATDARWDAIRAGYAVHDKDREPTLAFDEVTRWEIRWGPAYG